MNRLFSQFLKDPVFGDAFAHKTLVKTADDLGLTWEPWTKQQVFKVGQWFLSAVLPKASSSTFDASEWSDVALFDTEFIQLSENKRESYVVPSQALVDKGQVIVQSAIENAFCKLPLLVTPLDHTEDRVGGYHTDAAFSTLSKVRHLNAQTADYVRLGETALAAINNIQHVGYVVNDFVLSWIDSIKWEIVQRANAANLAGGKQVVPVLGKYVPFVDGLGRKHGRQTYRTESVVAAAHKYAGHVFYHAWLPDYRGRMYPLSSILTPQGTDFEKSLLKFAEQGPVTDAAVYWLKIQLANCFGLDKKSFAERVAWVDANHQLISAVALDPIESFDSWSTASEPWEFLAACEEFHACVIAKTRNTTNLPVAVDATCSGIQILSGITRDAKTAHLVNVSPSDAPQDAYMAVATKAIETLQDKLPADALALIDRKVVKKVVMTVPYNATADANMGAVTKALKEKGVRLPMDQVKLIVNAIRSAVATELKTAIDFRDWLNSVAYLKAKSLEKGAPFMWTTPSGMVVVQNLNKWKTVRIASVVSGRASNLSLAVEPTDQLNSSKIRTATAPNLIHSLDASVLHIGLCDVSGEQFTVIHDSVLARACDMDSIQARLRDAYAQIFCGDVFDQFVEYFTPDADKLTAADRKKLPALPAQGDLDPNVVKQSPYFFS